MTTRGNKVIAAGVGIIEGIGNATSGLFGYVVLPTYLRRTPKVIKDRTEKIAEYNQKGQEEQAIQTICSSITEIGIGRSTAIAIPYLFLVPEITERIADREQIGTFLTAYIVTNALSAGYEIVRGAIKSGTHLVQKARETYRQDLEKMVN